MIGISASQLHAIPEVIGLAYGIARSPAVQAAIRDLPPDYREVVVLRHFGGLSYDEIADAVGVPAKTVTQS